MICQLINYERDENMNFNFLSIQAEEIQTAKPHGVSGANSISPCPSMDLKKDRLSPVVHLVLPLRRIN